jgi:hypothetical protein
VEPTLKRDERTEEDTYLHAFSLETGMIIKVNPAKGYKSKKG